MKRRPIIAFLALTGMPSAQSRFGGGQRSLDPWLHNNDKQRGEGFLAGVKLPITNSCPD